MTDNEGKIYCDICGEEIQYEEIGRTALTLSTPETKFTEARTSYFHALCLEDEDD